MGLDITVYQKIKKASEKKIKEDAYDFEAFVISDCWKDRVKNLEYGQFYVGKSVGSHSTGYGSHRFFRDNLCDVVGIPKTWTEIDGDKTKPFYELINFADNEGCLDWEVSENLYNDFINHITLGTQPPEEYRSDFWKGGMPYVSLSHYPDLNGDAVPGMTESVWIDGDRFKAKGSFLATPLGEACFKAVKLDTSGPPHPIGPVRISIAFLDYGHIHKSNNFKFIRNDEEDYCEECLKEFMNMSGVGKRYIKGHLIHLAMTRVPMNERTDMEVEKSMTTRKEDALSIVEDEELIEPIEEKAKLVGKSELIIKADEVEEAKHGKEDMPMHDEEEDDEEEAKKKKKEEKKPEAQKDLSLTKFQKEKQKEIKEIKKEDTKEIVSEEKGPKDKQKRNSKKETKKSS